MGQITFLILLILALHWVVVYPYFHMPQYGDRLFTHHTDDHGLHYRDYGHHGYGHQGYSPHYREHGYHPHYNRYGHGSPHKAVGRETKYTVKNPHKKGHLKVTETHVEMNREMHPHEAEHTMKNIMSSMGGNRDHFKDFVKGMGFHF